MVLQAFLVIILYLFPFFAGILFIPTKRQIHLFDLLQSYVFGQLFIWALFQIVAPPLIVIRADFRILFFGFLALLLFLVIRGIFSLRRIRWDFHLTFPKSPLIWLIALASIFLIGYQVYTYIALIHIDQDDARWIACANDTLRSNKMLLHNPATGEYVNRFVKEVKKDVYSPWSMYLAFCSRFTTIKPVVFWHTVYAPYLLLLSYSVYALIARRLFSGKSEQIIFVFFISLINLFFAGPNRIQGTQSIVTLTRIWQGKASVAAIGIPAIVLQFLNIQKDNTLLSWLLLSMICCVCCMMSGIGIILSSIAVGLYGAYLVFCKGFRNIPYYILSLLPALLYGSLYYFQIGIGG